MGNSARKAVGRLHRLAYRDWEDRVDELVSLAGFRAGEVGEGHLKGLYDRGVSAGLAAELLIEMRRAAGR
ncbi:MAG: hypothetical protein K2X87_30895 [Gemmataceae bacterium]|nr:hypothetical protein [Gemmataceae bacterium]